MRKTWIIYLIHFFLSLANAYPPLMQTKYAELVKRAFANPDFEICIIFFFWLYFGTSLDGYLNVRNKFELLAKNVKVWSGIPNLCKASYISFVTIYSMMQMTFVTRCERCDFALLLTNVLCSFICLVIFNFVCFKLICFVLMWGLCFRQISFSIISIAFQ